MKDRCNDFWEGIVDLAEGREAPAALTHLQQCQDCSRKFAQLQSLMEVGKGRFFDAPSDLIESVKGLMPRPERRLLRLLHTTTAWTGARAAAEDFQIIAGDGEDQVRLMYSRTPKGWEVMGRAPSAEWAVVGLASQPEMASDGRFSFKVADLSKTGFFLIGPNAEWVVPSAEEMLSSGSDGGR